MLCFFLGPADKAPDKIWPAHVCVMLDVRDIYFCVVFRGWPKVRDTALMLENVSTMWSFSLYNGAHYIVILMLLSRNKQKKAQLIMKNDHKSVGFLFSQNICPYVLVIERGIKLTMGKTLQESSFSSESVDSVKKDSELGHLCSSSDLFSSHKNCGSWARVFLLPCWRLEHPACSGLR